MTFRASLTRVDLERRKKELSIKSLKLKSFEDKTHLLKSIVVAELSFPCLERKKETDTVKKIYLPFHLISESLHFYSFTEKESSLSHFESFRIGLFYALFAR